MLDLKMLQNSENQKNECKTWYQTHEFVEEIDFINKLHIAKGYLFFKFEPFVLHVQCRTPVAAKILVMIVYFLLFVIIMMFNNNISVI